MRRGQERSADRRLFGYEAGAISKVTGAISRVDQERSGATDRRAISCVAGAISKVTGAIGIVDQKRSGAIHRLQSN